MKGHYYKGLKLVKAKRWYVEFYFLVPTELRKLNEDLEWERFRVYEDINRIKDKDEKEKFGNLLFTSVKFSLENGDYNPFKHEERLFVKREGPLLTAADAIEYFNETISQKSVDNTTEYRYIRTAKIFLEYLQQKGKAGMPFEQVDELLITDCLQFYKRSVPWSNRNYNNNLGFLSIVFNFLKRKKKITHNPCDNIEKLPFISLKHRYYDDPTLNKLMDKLKEKDPYLLIIAQFVYYAGVRSSKEIINLQVGDILMDRNRIRFQGQSTKGKREDYILLDPHLKKIIEDAGIMKYPSNYYVFTFKLVPGENKSAEDWMQKRFRKVREELKLGEDYTLYSFKHTRAVHLLTDGAQPVDIMQLFRHHDLTTTTKYIRDLGFDLNAKFTEKSRKI